MEESEDSSPSVRVLGLPQPVLQAAGPTGHATIENLWCWCPRHLVLLIWEGLTVECVPESIPGRSSLVASHSSWLVDGCMSVVELHKPSGSTAGDRG